MNRSTSTRSAGDRTRHGRVSKPAQENSGMLARKQTLCEELIRIGAVLEKLRHRRRVGADMSTDDLLEIFYEERERLLTQLWQLDAQMADGYALTQDPVSYSRGIELRRAAIAADAPLDFR